MSRPTRFDGNRQGTPLRPIRVTGDDRRARGTALAQEVYEPLQRYLRRRCPPGTDADDVLADTLLVLWRRLDEVPEDARLPWAYGVAAGCLRNAERARHRRTRLLLRAAREPLAPPPDEDPALAAALEGLGEADREVLRLWAWERLAPREIAVVLGTTPGAASTRLYRATARLRAELAGEDPRGAGQVRGRQGTEAPR